MPAQRLPARRAVRFGTEFLEPEAPVFTAEDVDAARPVGALERGENLAAHARVDAIRSMGSGCIRRRSPRHRTSAFGEAVRRNAEPDRRLDMLRELMNQGTGRNRAGLRHFFIAEGVLIL